MNITLYIITIELMAPITIIVILKVIIIRIKINKEKYYGFTHLSVNFSISI